MEQSQLNALMLNIDGVSLADMSDRWVWTMEGSGEFSVASIRSLIDKCSLPDVTTKTRWITGVPSKWVIKASSLGSPEQAKEVQLEILENEIDTLEMEFSQSDQNVAFCHNDLQYDNIVIEDETRTITLIDYEYASYNPVAYDLANHFC
ncbi:probable choline kinase 1 [Tanacetum coccineum]